jgi:pilus assembly protein Flp/PilA
MRQLRLFLNDQSGATAVEYGLLAALVSVAIIGGVTAAGQAIAGMFNWITAQWFMAVH